MHTITLLSTLLLLLTPLTNTLPTTLQPTSSTLNTTNTTLYPVTPLHVFPNGTNLENLVIRTDGLILLSSSGLPQLWLLDPAHANGTARLLATIPHVNSLQGMVLLNDSLVAVLAGNQTTAPTYAGVKGSWSVYLVWLSSATNSTNTSNTSSIFSITANIQKLVSLPNATLPDGFAPLNPTLSSSVDNNNIPPVTNTSNLSSPPIPFPFPPLLITGDSEGSSIYTINLTTLSPNTSSAFAFPSFSSPLLTGLVPPSSPSPDFQNIGINGLKFSNDTAYFTNSARQLLLSVPYDTSTGLPRSQSQSQNISTLQTFDTFVDDFQILPSTSGFLISAEDAGILHAVPSTNTTTLVAKVPGADACVWGQTETTKCTLYVTYQLTNVSGLVSVDMKGSGLLEGC